METLEIMSSLNTKNIRIISGANLEYKEFYDKLKEDATKLGYGFSGYDYGGLGEGIPFDVNIRNTTIDDYAEKYVGKIPGKPLMILDALNRTDDFIVYLDADVRMKDNINEILYDYDIGVTVHEKEFHDCDDRYQEITGYLNAGVIFVNNTEGARRFIEKWIKEIEKTESKSDQEGLVKLLKKHIDEWEKESHMIDGIKVEFFPSAVYNYTGKRGQCDNPKIKHFPGTKEEKIAMGALN